MQNKTARVELIENYGDKSDAGLVYISEIHAYDENDKEVLTNEFINSYNNSSECKFYHEDDDIGYERLRSEFAKNIGVPVDLIY